MRFLLLTGTYATAGFALLLTGCDTTPSQQTTTTRTTSSTTHVGSNFAQPDSGSTSTSSPNSLCSINLGYAGGHYRQSWWDALREGGGTRSGAFTTCPAEV